MVRRILAAAALAVIASSQAFTDETAPSASWFRSGLGETDLATLAEHRYLYRYDKDREGPLLLPGVSMSEGLLDAWNEGDHSIFIEAVSFHPYPEGGRDDLEAYNLFQGVRAISGITYTPTHGGEAGEPTVLFDEVHRVSGARDRNVDPDIVHASIPRTDSFKVHMKEANMGRGIYGFRYDYDGEAILMSIRNREVMRNVIKVLEPGGMEMRFLYVPEEDGILVYASCSVELQNERTVRRMLTPWGYFHNRMKILLDWLYGGLFGPSAELPLRDGAAYAG